MDIVEILDKITWVEFGVEKASEKETRNLLFAICIVYLLYSIIGTIAHVSFVHDSRDSSLATFVLAICCLIANLITYSIVLFIFAQLDIVVLSILSVFMWVLFGATARRENEWSLFGIMGTISDNILTADRRIGRKKQVTAKYEKLKQVVQKAFNQKSDQVGSQIKLKDNDV